MTYAEAMERYGIDRPDLRYGLEIFDVERRFRGVGVRRSRSGARAGGRVRGIRVPGGASLSRKQLDEIEADAKSGGARRTAAAEDASNGALEGPAAKFLADGRGRTARAARGRPRAVRRRPPIASRTRRSIACARTSRGA